MTLPDFKVLNANFGASKRTFSQGDFNYASTVNLQAFNLLASRGGTIVSPAAGASGWGAATDNEDGDQERLSEASPEGP